MQASNDNSTGGSTAGSTTDSSMAGGTTTDSNVRVAVGSATSSSNVGGGGGARFRPLLPNIAAESSKRPAAPVVARPRKKRAAVQAACQNCRRRKVKCDGNRPVCAPCTSSDVICQYSVPEGLSQRDAERQRMTQVDKSYRDLLTILDILRRGHDTESDEILRQVKSAHTLEEAVARIADASLLLPPLAQVLPVRGSGLPSPDGHHSSSSESSFVPQQKLITSPFNSPDHMFETLYPKPSHGHEFTRSFKLATPDVLPVSRWLAEPGDDNHLTHLLTLFWTWDNTFINFFDRDMFLEDLRCADPLAPPPPGVNHVFCSSFLVNCLLATSCLYSTHPSVYVVPGDHNTRGHMFLNAARRLLEEERKRPSITLVQGIALLWLVEGSIGDGKLAEGFYMEMYSTYYLTGLDHIADTSARTDWSSRQAREIQAISHILWGFYYLNAKIAINFEQRLRIPRPRMLKTFEDPRVSYLARLDSAMSQWSAYPVDLRCQPSYHRERLVAQVAFAEIVDELMLAICRDEQGKMPKLDFSLRQHLERIYDKLMRWKAELAEYLLPNNSVLPSVLTVHATFDMAVLRLLLPLAGSIPNEPFARSTPAALKLGAVFSLMNQVWTFRSLYTLKNEYWFMQACIMAAQAVLFNLNGGSIDVFVRACQGLHEMGEYIKLANKHLSVIQGLIRRYQVQIPDVGRSVKAKYFVALEGRQSSAYIDNTRLVMYMPSASVESSGGGGGVVDEVQVGLLLGAPTHGHPGVD